jgi:hypothetical protein
VKTADPRAPEWEAELAALEAENPFEAHAAAHAKVCAAMATYDAKKAELEDAGIAAVKRSPINSTVTYAKPLVPLRRVLDEALAARRDAEAKCQRIDVLRRTIDAGSTHTPFRHYNAPKISAAEARERGSRMTVVRNGVQVIVESPRAPTGEPSRFTKAQWQEEQARRRAEGDAIQAEREATRERIKRQKAGN